MRLLIALLLAGLMCPRSLLAEQIVVIADDFVPQPLRGDKDWYYTRMGSNRGVVMGESDWGVVEFGQGKVHAQIGKPGVSAWLGGWMALRHVINENQALDAQHIFAPEIKVQGRLVGIRAKVLGGRGTLQLELQGPANEFPWRISRTLSGGAQTLEFSLPVTLGKVRNLNWLVVGRAGDFVDLDEIDLLLDVPAMDVPHKAFLWSYNMLLLNWDPNSGLARDRANFEAGAFENLSGTGLLASSTVHAYQLGLVSREDAVRIIDRITDAVLAIPTAGGGVLPHFTTRGSITPGTEYSSLDGSLTYLALLVSRHFFLLPTDRLEVRLKGLDWNALVLADGAVSHGYAFDKSLIPYGWRDYGSESVLSALVFCAATGQVPTYDSTSGRTFNGSGFIDAMAGLFMPEPASGRNLGTAYRQAALEAQRNYYPPGSCYSRLGLIGVSAGEVPDLSLVEPDQIYQAFGIGGVNGVANDGSALMGHGVILPHYAAMIAAEDPAAATKVFAYLMDQGIFTPLTAVESLMLTDEDHCSGLRWNALIGQWNTGLQALGWGRFLTGSGNGLYSAFMSSDLLRTARESLFGMDNAEIDRQPPGVPGGFKLQGISNGIAMLSWTSPGDFDLAGTLVLRSTSVVFTAADTVARLGRDAISYGDTMNTPGTTYYSVRAIDATGNLSEAATPVAAARTVFVSLPNPSSLSFAGKTRSLPLKVTNSGNTPLHIKGSIIGPNAGNFRLTPNPTVVPAGTTRTFRVGFIASPPAGPNQSATLVLDHDASNRPQLNIPLMGDVPPNPPGRLSAVVEGGQVALTWNPGGEADLRGYIVYRSRTSGFTPAPGDSIALVAVSRYTDHPPAPGTYYYKVVAVDQAKQKSRVSSQVSVVLRRGAKASGEENRLAIATGLESSYPNPFNSTTVIRYAVATAGEVSVEVFNLGGQKIKTLMMGYQEPGYHQITWAGDDALGRQTASGIYVVVLRSGREMSHTRVLLLR